MKDMDRSEDFAVNPQAGRAAPTMGDLVRARLSRRGVLAGLGAVSGLALAGCGHAARPSTPPVPGDRASAGGSAPGFIEISRGLGPSHEVSPGHRADILVRWGDPLFEDSPPFDPMNQTSSAQLRQFGYNNDFIGFVPLAADPEGRRGGLLCVNHEYTSTNLMFPGLKDGPDFELPAALCEVEMAAHGGSIVEIRESAEGWKPVLASPYNRRITAHMTPMQITGPAAGSDRLKTSADPDGRMVVGTMNNCAGGITPWGTWLMAEENFNGNFMGELPDGHPESANHARYGVPAGWYGWGRHFPRFDLSQEPNEPNRFGWIVEVDPFDPQSVPKKRTALGRVKHEGAESVIAPDGRVVVYSGDDQRFEYVYKFVSEGRHDPANRAANMDLLDHGTLYVARFDAEGMVVWLPLIFGNGPLTPENGFNSQADVLIETRRAADLLGATPMDRPEWAAVHPTTGEVYVTLTNNDGRGDKQPTDKANPRPHNLHGQILRFNEQGADPTATTFAWELFLLAGEARGAKDKDGKPVPANLTGTINGDLFSSPDGLAFDAAGRLWIQTDYDDIEPAMHNMGCNQLLCADPATREVRRILVGPRGCEITGLAWSPDGKAMWANIQHPGLSFPASDGRTRPRSTTLLITRNDGGVIGS